MSQITALAPTPRYVLKSGKKSIYPRIVFDDPEISCSCVYGFSGMPIYNKFIQSTEQLLTPYPLVRRFLSNQIGKDDLPDSTASLLRLVILDATEFAQPLLSAATMATVHQAQQENAEQVSVEFELEFDPETESYSIRKSLQIIP